MRNVWTAVVLGALALLGAAAAFGQSAAKPVDTPADKRGKQAASQPSPSTAQGLTVFVDPVTRQIRQPSASEIGALGSASQTPARAAAVAAPATPPKIIQGPGGAVGILLDDSAMSFTVATRKPDGKIAVECITGGEEAVSRINSAGQHTTPAAPETK